ncbi:hypothetical protein EVAR_9914_1 [Eumeta japonica]|uniref:Uncharacterized protein n=1 Tax=Eumeta variegata TaxID=151549 RepID=A0A4C1TQF0_EUMVA|nr:hypothetical protein EVAR_9914_1 [Eumeta japonica]
MRGSQHSTSVALVVLDYMLNKTAVFWIKFYIGPRTATAAQSIDITIGMGVKSGYCRSCFRSKARRRLSGQPRGLVLRFALIAAAPSAPGVVL